MSNYDIEDHIQNIEIGLWVNTILLGMTIGALFSHIFL